MLSKSIDCIGYCMAIISCLGLGVLFIKQKRVFAVLVFLILFSVGWRSFSKIISSRYLSILIVYSLFLAGVLSQYAILHSNQLKMICLLLFVCFIIQTFDTLCTFNNKYIFDAAEIVNDSKKKDAVLINDNEKDRLKSSDMFLYTQQEKETKIKTMKEMIKSLSTWNGRLMIYDNINYSFNDQAVNDYDLIAQFVTNKSKTKKTHIYTRSNNEKIAAKKVLSENLIANGDMEISIDQPTIRKKFIRWIEDGMGIYDKDDLLLPKHVTLVSNRTYKKNKIYPTVYSTNNDLIDGERSLFVHFPEGDNTNLFFLNRIPGKPGRLSFSICFLKHGSTIKLLKYDYDSNEKRIAKSNSFVYYVYFNDNEVHAINIDVEQDEFLGVESIFFLQGNDSEIILDNVEYHLFANPPE